MEMEKKVDEKAISRHKILFTVIVVTDCNERDQVKFVLFYIFEMRLY